MDESGKPNYSDCEKEYVLAAITIHESEYRHVEEELTKVKGRYFQDRDPEDVEIHATDIISRKGIFSKMSLDERLRLLKDVLGILGNIECTVNCTLIRKNLLEKRRPDVDSLAYKFLFERLCMTHEKLNRKLMKKGSDPQFGILFMDSIQPQIDEGIKTKVREMVRQGTEFTDNDYIIEDVVFVDSRYRSMSQIVDCVAYVVRRYHRLCFRDDSDENEMEFYKDCYDMILPHIRRDNNGSLKGAGLKIYPKK